MHTLFGLLLLGYEVITITDCQSLAFPRYWSHSTSIMIDQENKQIVLVSKGQCQSA